MWCLQPPRLESWNQDMCEPRSPHPLWNQGVPQLVVQTPSWPSRVRLVLGRSWRSWGSLNTAEVKVWRWALPEDHLRRPEDEGREWEETNPPFYSPPLPPYVYPSSCLFIHPSSPSSLCPFTYQSRCLSNPSIQLSFYQLI